MLMTTSAQLWGPLKKVFRPHVNMFNSKQYLVAPDKINVEPK